MLSTYTHKAKERKTYLVKTRKNGTIWPFSSFSHSYTHTLHVYSLFLNERRAPNDPIKNHILCEAELLVCMYVCVCVLVVLLLLLFPTSSLSSIRSFFRRSLFGQKRTQLAFCSLLRAKRRRREREREREKAFALNAFLLVSVSRSRSVISLLYISSISLSLTLSLFRLSVHTHTHRRYSWCLLFDGYILYELWEQVSERVRAAILCVYDSLLQVYCR